MQVATGKSILGGVAIGPLRVYRKEETQTAAASALTAEEELNEPVRESIRKRLPWLVILLALAVGMQFDVVVMVSLKAVQDFLCTFVNGAPNKRLLGYSIRRQWQDVMPAAALSAVMCAVVIGAGYQLAWLPAWPKLLLQILCGIVVYVALAWAFRLESFCFLWGLVKNRARKGDSQ